MDEHHKTGALGEELACRYLEAKGYSILERNWRSGHRELDLVAQRGGTLAIVEVKTRSSLRQGPPAAAVDARKVARLRALAAAWASTHETPPHAGMRLDVVSILLRDARPALLRHHRAVDASWG